MSTSILRVSQQIYSEAVTILYRENAFDASALKLLSGVINPTSFNIIPHITIKITNLEQTDLPVEIPKDFRISAILYDICPTSISGRDPVRQVNHDNVIANLKRIESTMERKLAIRLFQLPMYLDDSVKQGLGEMLARV
ncbi:hypothetical protein H2199_001033 [Coniosporium tulheliwenetii]|uniref:Uncharacterized protein n=1 Tax=Coniosporium tulheliwenetii TaxID=3383036 RepID=A0ACC2ZNI8_9PEZI|nr:hypothetical protein H2199_001033 [Cladosporium sp. JES 115]